LIIITVLTIFLICSISIWIRALANFFENGGNMTRRSILAALLCAAVCLCLAFPAWALFALDVKNAKELMAEDHYNDAIRVLKRHIEKNPDDGEAYFQLGLCYLETDSILEADESFTEAAALAPDHNAELANIYKKLAYDHLQSNEIERAKIYYDRMVSYDPALMDTGFLKQLGYRYLRKAADSTGAIRELFKERAAELVGQELVDQIFPGPSETDVFIGEYTDADITEPDKDGGWIHTFDWAEMRTGKAIIIQGQIPPGGNQIYYYRGEEYDPPYLPTVDGGKTIPIKKRPATGPFAIWIQKGKNIKVTVRVVDEAPTPPRVDLIPVPQQLPETGEKQ
jgi:tetratricopeptide (TPR) repeat protein